MKRQYGVTFQIGGRYTGWTWGTRGWNWGGIVTLNFAFIQIYLTWMDKDR